MSGAGQEDDSRAKANMALDRRIEQAVPSGRLDIVKEALGRADYRLEDPQGYADLVNAAFVALWRCGVPDRAAAQRLEQGYVLSALESVDWISAPTELRLAARLQANAFAASPPDGEETRSKLDLIFHAWRRMEGETKIDFDFADRPTENVSPPHEGSERGEVRFAGMDPIYIKDAAVRAEYQAAIGKNRAKAAERLRQIALRNMKEPFLRHAEGFILSAIRSGTVTEADVSSKLSLVRDDKARERVLAKIRALQQ
jgi:hypothetical protein